MIEIRHAKGVESAAIREIHTKVLAGAKLVQPIAEEGGIISLVAVSDGKVVGHLRFGRAILANSPHTFSAVGVAPIAVLPDSQREGIGSQLIREGLKKCQQIGYQAVFAIGDPAYYSRFGFTRAADFGLQNEYGLHDEFMVLPLRDGALHGVSGMILYPPSKPKPQVEPPGWNLQMAEVEQRTLAMLLAGDDPMLTLLRAQLNAAVIESRELTGVGFFTNFVVPECVERTEPKGFVISDVHADLRGLAHGVGLPLFVRAGCLSTLEGFTYEGLWPSEPYITEIYYMHHEPPSGPMLKRCETRDMKQLRADWSGQRRK